MRDKTNSQKSHRASIHMIAVTRSTCAATIEAGLSETPGVEQADVNFASDKASTEYHPTEVDPVMKNRRNRNPESERRAVREFGQAVRTSLLIPAGPVKLQQTGDPIDMGSLPPFPGRLFSSPVALALPEPMTR